MGVHKPIEETGIWRGLLHVERFILVTTSVLAAGLVAVGVFTRYVLGIDFFGQEEIITVVAMWLYWVGGIYGSYEDSHIKADILATFIPNPKIVKYINVVIMVVSIAVTIVFLSWSFDYVAWSLQSGGKTAGLKIPLILSQIPLTIGFAMMLFYSVYHLVRILRPRADKQKQAEDLTVVTNTESAENAEGAGEA